MVGKGAAQAHADSFIRQLADTLKIPVLSTSMGRGVVPDDHPLSVIAARSTALAKSDVVLILGARSESASKKLSVESLVHADLCCYVQSCLCP